MWGDKGEEYRPDKCYHDPEDGCMWCCRHCNYDRHLCLGCGTVVAHGQIACEECDG